MIKILADIHLYELTKFLPTELECSYYNPQLITPNPGGFNAWLLNTVTKVNPSTYPNLPNTLKYIGTGSSGSDHLDKEFLKSKNIWFDDAKGCNAQAVAEYVLTALLLLSLEFDDIHKYKIGVIGVGAAGSKVNKLLTKFGFSTALYDPPRELRDPTFTSASLNDVLNCDILTFHVPLSSDGEFSTYHWLDELKLADNTFFAIINAARGGVIDESAVSKAYSEGKINHLIIDVWENEPDFNPDFFLKCFIATPHIAGYSVQSKLNASRIISKKLCTYFKLNHPVVPLPEKRTFEVEHIKNLSIRDVLLLINPILDYMNELKGIISVEDKAKRFAKLRSDTPMRFEYEHIRIPNINFDKYPILKKLGVSD